MQVTLSLVLITDLLSALFFTKARSALTIFSTRLRPKRQKVQTSGGEGRGGVGGLMELGLRGLGE